MELRLVQNPRNDARLDAIVLHAPDTVNIVALTSDGDLILVKQFRFGIDDFLTELPAGLIDPGEDRLEAARRELREETGYETDQWIYLGVTFLNPAYVTNRCFHYLALDCKRLNDQSMDHLEDLQVEWVASEQITSFLRSDGIQDAVGRVAIGYVFPPPDHKIHINYQ